MPFRKLPVKTSLLTTPQPIAAANLATSLSDPSYNTGSLQSWYTCSMGGSMGVNTTGGAKEKDITSEKASTLYGRQGFEGCHRLEQMLSVR